jgi:predicted ATP-grasp superfamily ATP-dependent carboligase
VSSPPRIPVLVLGGGLGLTTLGVIRTLGRAGIPAYVVADTQGLAHRSRWYRPAPHPAGGAHAETDLERFLEDLPLERAVLMPCSDIWAMLVAQLGAGHAERFPSCQSPASVLETLLDKGHFAAALDAAGVPHPITRLLARATDLAALPDEAFRDSFLKPRDSQRFFRRFEVKAFRVRGRDDATERMKAVDAAGLTVLLQEYIPGPASNHVFVDGFVDGAGQPQAVFARRRLRMFPVDFGNSSYMVSVALDEVPTAVAAVQRLLRHVRYRGIFSAEFKYDERDEEFKILEVNARPWWYVEFTARCGVDVCTMAYRDALGLPVEPAGEYRVGYPCVYPYYDYGACRELRRRGQLSLSSWVRSWLTAEQPVFRWSDPYPALVETAKGLGRRLRKLASGPPVPAPALSGAVTRGR